MQAAVKTIGIGAGADAEKVIGSACRVSVPCDIVCYSRRALRRCLKTIKISGF